MSHESFKVDSCMSGFRDHAYVLHNLDSVLLIFYWKYLISSFMINSFQGQVLKCLQGLKHLLGLWKLSVTIFCISIPSNCPYAFTSLGLFLIYLERKDRVWVALGVLCLREGRKKKKTNKKNRICKMCVITQYLNAYQWP